MFTLKAVAVTFSILKFLIAQTVISLSRLHFGFLAKSAATNNTSSKSEFDYSNWKNWSPDEWVRWSASKEYKESFLNPLNPYLVKEGKMPFKIHQDLNPDDDPVPDVRSNSAVFMTLFKNPAKRTETKNKDSEEKYLEEEVIDEKEKEEKVIENEEMKITEERKEVTTDRTNHFPKPTVSPTKDPHYVYREYSGPSKNRNNQNLGLSSEYIIKKEVTTEVPTRIRNAFEEGRYEFRPSRFRQKEPILLSGSSLFGSVSDPVKSSRQTGGSNYPQAVNLENILIRSKNISSDENPSSLGQFSNPTSYEDYIKNLERFSGLPVLGNLANSDPSPATGTAFQIRPPGPGSRPSSHFSEGYVPPPFPFAPPPPQNSPPDGSSSTSTSTSGKIEKSVIFFHFAVFIIMKNLIK